MPPSNNYYNKKLQPQANKLRKNMTKAEACLWKYVLRNRWMKGYTFRRQRPIDNYIVDFVCLPLKLIIEVDGATHDLTEVHQMDIQREKKLISLGFHIIRFRDDEVLKQINFVRSQIKYWIEKQANISPPSARRGNKNIN